MGIARALAHQLKFIISDELVPAQAASIPSQELNILKDLKREVYLTHLF